MATNIDDHLRFSTEALKLRSYRQELISSNIANADTPNYKAVDFEFADALQAAAGGRDGTRAGSRAGIDPPSLLYREPSQLSLDGNSVEIESEQAKFADNTIRYEAAMRILNGKLKTLLSAVQGQ